VEPVDYTTLDEGAGESLLDSDGQPTTEALAGRHRSLARLAAAIQAEAPNLNPVECEYVVRWMKHWKYEPRDLRYDVFQRRSAYLGLTEEIWKSPDIKQGNKMAGRHVLVHDGWMLLAFAVACVTLGSYFAPDVRWYWSVAGAPIVLGAYIKASLSLEQARSAWAQQERRHLWRWIRNAETLDDLDTAGLFTETLDMDITAKAFDKTSLATCRAIRERLSDALYRDPTDRLL
jgi:hypothetical protein